MSTDPSGLEAPRNLTCEAVGNGVRAVWSRPQGITAYSFRLFMREAPATPAAAAPAPAPRGLNYSMEGWKVVAQDKDLYEWVSGPLPPVTKFQFKCQSYGIRGDGPTTPIVEVTTNQSVPSDPPRNIRPTRVDLDAIELCWDAPVQTNGVLEGYLLFIDQQGMDTYVEVELNSSTTSFKHNHLYRDTVYRYQVCAFTAKGEGPMSDILCVRTKQDAMSRFLKKEPTPAAPVKEAKKSSIRGKPENLASMLEEKPEPQQPSTTMPARPVTAPRLVWKPPVEPAIPEAPAVAEEAETDATALARKRQSLRDKFSGIAQQNELESKLKAASIRVAAQTGNQLTQGASSTSLLAGGRSESRIHFDAQLEADEGEEESVTGHLGEDAYRIIKAGKDLKTLTGTIRGKKNAVRAALATFQQVQKFESELLEQLFHEEKNNTIVVYTTSVAAIRETYENCQKVLKIFENLKKKIRVKDIAMDARFTAELMERLPSCEGVVPQVFVNYVYVGDVKKVIELNETHVFDKMLAGFEARPLTKCATCNGFGFVPCRWCMGSKKSIENKFGNDPLKRALKCTVCNENGLQRCEDC